MSASQKKSGWKRRGHVASGLAALLIAFLIIASTGCSELQQPRVEPFFSETTPPPKQELRWTNGKPARSMDPAMASAAPETDLVRAVFEGLTELDSRSLRESPAVAEKWQVSDGGRTWHFHLRKDAKWSNGERVTARDFVVSWRRLLAFGDKVTNRYLFENIVGMQRGTAERPVEPRDFLIENPSDGVITGDSLKQAGLSPNARLEAPRTGVVSATPVPDSTAQPPGPKPQKFGVEAVDDSTLKVSLVYPDPDFPKLVANPIFRPVHDGGTDLELAVVSPEVITNGPFRVLSSGNDGILLEASETYWNRDAIGLERVRIIPSKSAEGALNAYKTGDVDVVTNAAFEPLALKLLAPYDDFKSSPHSALNFYEFNVDSGPFSDRRVRQAFAISIDRTKLTEGELQGIYQPATTFSPHGERGKEPFALDIVKAKDLLDKAGFPGGEGFPPVRLVVNRNDVQQRIARSIARMWKQNLNVESEIVVVENDAVEEVRKSRDFDLIRRGVVLPTNDQLVNIGMILGSVVKPLPVTVEAENRPWDTPSVALPLPADDTLGDRAEPAIPEVESGVMTADDVIYDARFIPLYFPMSYGLVKPYVRGFELNSLDAPSLKELSIDSGWQPRPRP